MSNNHLTGIIKIGRPLNMSISMVSIFLAAFITGTIHPLINVIFACISGGIITAAANTINDYFDLDIDRINRPRRPLVTGLLTEKFALRLALFEFLTGSLLALFINFLAFGIASVMSVLLFLYSYIFKRKPLIGNIVVSFSTAMAFVYGGVAVYRLKYSIFPALFAFFMNLIREVVKDIQDMRGDAQGQARTFPLLFGTVAAQQLISALVVLLMLVLLIPYLINWYSINFFIVVMVGIYPVLIYVLYNVWKNSSPQNMGIISAILKADMLVGLLAIYLG